MGADDLPEESEITPENAATAAALRAARRRTRQSQKDVAHKLGITRQAYGYYERGLGLPAGGDLKRLAKAVDASVDEILSGRLRVSDGVEDSGANYDGLSDLGRPRRVPVVSWIAASGYRDASDPFVVGDADKFVLVTDVSDRAFALRVRGPSMEPEFSDGSIIVVEPNRSAESGDYVVVRLNDANEATFKQLHIDGGRRWLRPLNPQFPAMEIVGDAYICGVVVRQLKEY